MSKLTNISPVIVAEISKSWIDAQHASEDHRLLSQKFEEVINVNIQRGYTLFDWKIDRVTTRSPDGLMCLNEAIIAIFTLNQVHIVNASGKT